jgi:PII-like signaling protein
MLEVCIFCDEDDMVHDRKLYEHILRYLMHNQIAGATVFSALGGFGNKKHLHFPRKIGGADEGPIMIVFVDSEEKVRAVIPHLKETVRQGLITIKNVEIA